VWGLLKTYCPYVYEQSELASIDTLVRYGRTAPVHPDIVFLAIDAPSTSLSQLDDNAVAASKPLSLMKAGFPFSREVYADICDRLAAAGAKAMAFDVFFLAPKPEEDAIWRQAIDRYRDKVVIGMNFSDDQLDGFSTKLTLPCEDLFPDQDPSDNRLGYLNFWKNNYNVVADAQYRSNIENLNHKIAGAENLPKYYSLAARAVQKGGFPDLVPNDLSSRRMRFAGKPETKFPTYSLYKIFDPDSWSKTFRNGEFFKDKIVLVGPQGDWTKDELMTPWGLMNGAEIHLNAINDLLQNDFLFPASELMIDATVIASGLIAMLLALTIIGIGWRFLATGSVVVAYGLTVIWAYNGPGWLLPAVAPLGVFCGATGTGFIYDFVLTQIEKLRQRVTFERYYSRNVVKYLLDHTEAHKEMLAGTRKPVTVLFSDIRSFTTIVETTPDSHALVDKLNEYFTAMVDCVFRYDGSLDKFMGDGIMALWGNTPINFGPKEDAVRAVKSALAMLEELSKLNAKWRAEGKMEWRIGIGLNHGQVIVGDMGSQLHKEFGVVGDAINLGSRLEGLTKEYHLQLIVGERVAELVLDLFYLKSVDFVQVKGKTRPVQAFTVLGDRAVPLPPEQEKALKLYEEGISLFRTRNFSRARDLFAEALKITPDDFLTTQYVASSTAFITNPPDAGWTGIRIMTEK
jgi:adenylate cyclase